MVGNIVDVGWATIKSGCLPITVLNIFNREDRSCQLFIRNVLQWHCTVLCICRISISLGLGFTPRPAVFLAFDSATRLQVYRKFKPITPKHCTHFLSLFSLPILHQRDCSTSFNSVLFLQTRVLSWALLDSKKARIKPVEFPSNS